MKHDDSASRLRLLASAIQFKKKQDLGAKGGLLPFTKWFFPGREGMDFIEGPHHRVICSVLDRVLSGELNRVIFTVPPGYTKTELAVVNFMAKGFQINPAAKFIHATFDAGLAAENSDKVRSLVQTEEYQNICETPFEVRSDSKAKDRWQTTEGGGILAKAAGGPITGFRAGRMDKEAFTGALVIDDPLKPDDAFSPAKREHVNRRATNTFRSRLAHEGVPIIVIMQRLHQDDFVGHLLKGGTGDYWHHVDLPVLIENADEYPKEWAHGIPVPHRLPDGPLWGAKHNLEQIEILKADAYTYQSQYQGRPVTVEGALFDMNGFQEWEELPLMQWMGMYADTALKTGEKNDYSVFQLWGKSRGGAYLIDQIRGKWEAPELEKNALAFWAKYRNLGISVRQMKVEDKASGTGLIQGLRKKGIPVFPIPRERDKYTRGLDAAPWISSGMVWLPKHAPWILTLKAELQNFDGLGSGHDDQVDPLMDAINDMLSSPDRINLDNL